jgi:hypothetical protein
MIDLISTSLIRRLKWMELADGQILALRLSRTQLTRIVLRTGTGKLPGAGEKKEAPRSVAKGRVTDERSDASNFNASTKEVNYLTWFITE